MSAYVPKCDRFGRILARCPGCSDLWKTDKVWEDMKIHAARDMLSVLNTLENKSRSDASLADYVRGYNRALKDTKERLILKSKGLR
jgi:hypothetical protein